MSPTPFGSSLDPERQQLARRYARQRRGIWFLDQALGGLYVALWLGLGLHAALRDAVPLAQPFQVAAMLVAFAGGYTLLVAPIQYVRHRLARHYGLSTQSLGAWLADLAKGLAVGAVLGLIAVEGLYAIVGLAPGWWWLPAGLAALVFTVALTNLAPILIVPLFFKMRPLADADLAERLLALARRAGTAISGVYTIDLSAKGTMANAALMGWGNTRRIVLGDTLLDRYPPAEIAVVLAHELGHQVHRDIAKLIASQSMLTLAGLFLVAQAIERFGASLGIRGAADPAGLPFLALVLGVFSLVTAPVANAYSRWLERQADESALALTDDPRSFVAVMDRLADQNLAESQPPAWVEWLFYDHPSHARRVALAGAYRAGPRSVA
ncbi:MAG: M48 family metallopeptidase [Chloroflexi bacterium]|nr:M48 family metallopeptidase [Chloroflexota bacterium]